MNWSNWLLDSLLPGLTRRLYASGTRADLQSEDMVSVDMNPRAVAIIRRNLHVLLIHRIKEGREYWVLPGGSIEEGETAEEACCREVCEETGLDVVALRCVRTIENGGRRETYFAVSVADDEPILGRPERERESATNQYLLEWTSCRELADIDLRPAEAKTIVFGLAN